MPTTLEQPLPSVAPTRRHGAVLPVIELLATATDPTGVSAFYAALQAAANAALGSTLGAPITPVQTGAQGDFAYNYLNPSGAFNLNTYNYISGLVQAGDYPGTAKLGTGGSFPTAFLQLVNQIAFQFSAADQQTITNAQNAAQTQQLNVVQTFTGLYGAITSTQLSQAATVLGYTPTPFNYIVSYVMGYVWAGSKTPPLSWAKMQSAPNLIDLMPNLPPDGNPVVTAVSSYLNALGPSTALMDQQNYGSWILNLIKQALRYPSATNTIVTVDPQSGAAGTATGYLIPKSMQAIQNDLAGPSQIAMSLQVAQASSSAYNVSINGGTRFSFGGPILSFSGSAGASYNMESAQGAGSACNISIVYKGYSVVPLQPQALTPNAGTGWYYPSLLQEAYQNYQLGANAPTGFTFISSPVYALDVFPAGNFNLLSNLIISNYPTIVVNYSAGSYSLFQSQFSAQMSGTVKLFGFIPVGGASMSTYRATVQQGASNSQFSVSFSPPSTAGVPLLQQQAYVLGSVVASPAPHSTSLVHALLAATG